MQYAAVYDLLAVLIFSAATAFCAAAVLIAVPIVLLFIRLQRFYVSGVTSGSVKG